MKERDEVRECWDGAAEAWARFVREGKDISREYMNNPGMFGLLGDIEGERILDLGCGEGYNTRLLAKMGAKVTGVDFSENMIRLALEEEELSLLGIEYLCADATDLDSLDDSTFDIVTCFMVFMDFEDIDAVTGEIARVLKSSGSLFASIPHPCFEMSWEGGEKVAGWIYENMDDPQDRGRPLYVKQSNYFKSGRYNIDWKMQRINQPFKTISFKRTLTEYGHTLGAHGLYICDLVEPKPTGEGLAKVPELDKHLRVPQSIIFKAVKVTALQL
jgi:SAM-dependent methyltransferase